MKMCREKSVTLVLGGVRSGKSRYAQRLAETSESVAFIATAERRDDGEMHAKIERHRAERPMHWLTIEEPLQLSTAITAASLTSKVVLVDCLTIFAANLLEAHSDGEADQEQAIASLCEALSATESTLILVSNEVGSGVVPAYASGRKFRDLVGEINQRVAAVADRVLLLIAGLPLQLKGPVVPEGLR